MLENAAEAWVQNMGTHTQENWSLVFGYLCGGAILTMLIKD
jgi:hypothetical protein